MSKKLSETITFEDIRAFWAHRENDEALREVEKDFFEYLNQQARELLKRSGLFITAGAGLLRLIEMVHYFALHKMNLLFIGEPGTGKEILAEVYAKIIYKERFSVNCAGINKDLAASKLFGHVKGAYTGADEDRPGLFATAKEGVVRIPVQVGH